MAFLKAIWRGSGGKHKKMEPVDEKSLAKHFEDDSSSIMPEAITFSVKYLGSTLVSNDRTTSVAVNTILTMGKAAKRKRCAVNMAVTLHGIVVTDASTGSLILDASVYRISNCSTDPERGNVFAFFATNKYDVTECHAFQCSKRKMAETITLRIAHLFRVAYEVWQRGHQIMLEQKGNSEKLRNKTNNEPLLIDFTPNISNSANNWVRFESDREESSTPEIYSRKHSVPKLMDPGFSEKSTSSTIFSENSTLWT